MLLQILGMKMSILQLLASVFIYDIPYTIKQVFVCNGTLRVHEYATMHNSFNPSCKCGSRPGKKVLPVPAATSNDTNSNSLYPTTLLKEISLWTNWALRSSWLLSGIMHKMKRNVSSGPSLSLSISSSPLQFARRTSSSHVICSTIRTYGWSRDCCANRFSTPSGV